MNSNFRKLVFFVLLVGLAVVGYQYMIKPANKDLADAQAKVDSKMEQKRLNAYNSGFISSLLC